MIKDRANPKTPDYLAEMNFSPHFYRDKGRHAPEEGLGGSYWMLTYNGNPIGAVWSTWDHENGVHFRVANREGVNLLDDLRRPRVFASRADAANHLMRLHGIDANWEPAKGSPERSY